MFPVRNIDQVQVCGNKILIRWGEIEAVAVCFSDGLL